MFSPFFSFGLRFIWKHGGIGRVGHHQLVEKKISRWEKASDFSHAPFPPPLQMYSFPQNANKFPHLLENIQIYFCKYISTSYEQHTNIFPPRFDSMQTYSTSFGHSTNTQIYFFLRILDFPIKDHLLKLIWAWTPKQRFKSGLNINRLLPFQQGRLTQNYKNAINFTFETCFQTNVQFIVRLSFKHRMFRK